MNLRSSIVSLAILAASCASSSTEPTATGAGASIEARHVDLEGQPNFRDLGGYRAADGRTVKWGQVFRSGELGHLTDADVERLDELGLRTVVNFLLPEEIEEDGPDRLPSGTRSVLAPMTSEDAARLTQMARYAVRSADFDALPPTINPEIHQMLVEDGAEEYALLLRTMLDPKNRPIAFHCSHGIHRTGTGSAILLSLLGVPWETIREDYLLSNTCRAEEIEASLESARKRTAERLQVAPESVDLANARAFYVLEGNYIDGSLQRVVETYGSMENYAKEALGLTDDEITRLRTELLE